MVFAHDKGSKFRGRKLHDSVFTYSISGPDSYVLLVITVKKAL